MRQALRKSGIQPDWEKIWKAAKLKEQLFITPEIFFESWYAYTQDCQPSWNQLALALEETTGTDIYKTAAALIRENEGMSHT